MTLDTIAQFFQQWSALLGYCLFVGAAVVKMYFDLKWTKQKMKELQVAQITHDANDKLMEQKLQASIDRNKELSEAANKELNQKLFNIQQTVTEVNTYMKLLLGDKIKLG
jgi:hypothetical protein